MNATLRILSRQHEQVLARMNVVESRLRDDSDQSEFLRFLQGEVLQHFALEEEALFPVMQRYGQLQCGPLRVMDDEHRAFRSLLDDLRAAVRQGDRDLQRGVVIDLIDLLRAHILKEEKVLFPLAERFLNSGEMDEVDRKAAVLGVAKEAA